MSITGFITAQGSSYVLNMVSGEFPVPSYFVALTNTVATPYTSGDELDEVNAAEYSRAEYDNVSGAWQSTAGSMANAFTISFPVAASQWNTVKGWGLLDNAEGGNLLWAGPLSAPINVGPAQQVTIAPGGLTITIPMTSWAQSA